MGVFKTYEKGQQVYRALLFARIGQPSHKQLPSRGDEHLGKTIAGLGFFQNGKPLAPHMSVAQK